MEDYLRKLIAYKTVSSDQTANQEVLDYLEQFFAKRGLHCIRYTFEGYGALVATTQKDSKASKVMLGAHLDVVPGPDSLFQLREEQGKFMGRGVFDMKFAIASYMQILDTLGGSVSQYDLGIMITCEEEIGGTLGVGELIKLGYRPNVCILPDGASDWQIETFAKGTLHGTVTVHGKAAHGSKPWEGDSATFKLVDLLHDLKQYFADQTLNTNTLNIGIINGGLAINQIPASAYAKIDIRYLTPEDRQAILATIADLGKRYSANFVERDFCGEPCVNELTHPLIASFARSVEHVTGQEVSGMLSTGSSDARFFASVKVPCIICRPAGGGQHADDEWIDKQGCLQYPEVLIDYLNKVARI